jgi:hypothetical protein
MGLSGKDALRMSSSSTNRTKKKEEVAEALERRRPTIESVQKDIELGNKYRPFYLAFRDYDWHGKGEAGKKHRDMINDWRKVVMFFQFLGFAIGVLGIALFAALNFQNVSSPK